MGFSLYFYPGIIRCETGVKNGQNNEKETHDSLDVVGPDNTRGWGLPPTSWHLTIVFTLYTLNLPNVICQLCQ